MPGLLISHAWYGLGEGEMMRAEEAAAKGYAAFALDMYGKGKRATSVPEAMALRGELGSLGADVRLPVGAPTYTLPDHAPNPR